MLSITISNQTNKLSIRDSSEGQSQSQESAKLKSWVSKLIIQRQVTSAMLPKSAQNDTHPHTWRHLKQAHRTTIKVKSRERKYWILLFKLNGDVVPA